LPRPRDGPIPHDGVEHHQQIQIECSQPSITVAVLL